MVQVQKLRQDLEARGAPQEAPSLPVSTSSRFLDAEGAATSRCACLVNGGGGGGLTVASVVLW